MSSKSYLKRKYGITSDEYEQMLENQKGRCAICRVSFSSEKSKSRRICVDHCHSCKKVRGLLCFQCNRYVVAKNTLSSTIWLEQYLFYTEFGNSCKADVKWRKRRYANME